jgi:pimeloyl-ACP methyl ester carboxylesterase
VNQRGHGDSERPACCYTVEDFAADAVAFLDAVGRQRATLVGHSGSCFVALRVAATHPGRVARLVLIGSPVSLLGNQGVLEFQAAVHALPDPVPVDFVRGFQAAAAHLPLPEAFLERLVAESRKLPARVWRDALDGLEPQAQAGQGDPDQPGTRGRPGPTGLAPVPPTGRAQHRLITDGNHRPALPLLTSLAVEDGRTTRLSVRSREEPVGQVRGASDAVDARLGGDELTEREGHVVKRKDVAIAAGQPS